MDLEKNNSNSTQNISVNDGIAQATVNNDTVNAMQMQNIQQMQNMQQMQMQQMQMQQMQMQMQMMKKGNLNFVENLKGMFAKPIDTTKKLIVEKNITIPLIFIGAQALISSLMFAFSGSGKAFGIALLLSLVSTFLLALVMFVALKIKNVDISYSSALSIVASKSVIVALIDAIACFCLVFSTSVAFSIYYISSIVGVILVVATFLNIVVMEDNSKAIMAAVIVGIYYVVMMFIAYEVASSIISSMFSGLFGLGGLGGLGGYSSKSSSGLNGLLK